MNPNIPRDGFHWVSGEAYRAQQVPPLNVAKAVETGVGRERLREMEREFSRDPQHNAFAVVQSQTALDLPVTGAIEGDVDC